MAGRGVLGGGGEGGIGFVEKERVKGGGKEEGMDGTLGHLDRNWRRSMPPHHCSIAGTPPSPLLLPSVGWSREEGAVAQVRNTPPRPNFEGTGKNKTDFCHCFQ